MGWDGRVGITNVGGIYDFFYLHCVNSLVTTVLWTIQSLPGYCSIPICAVCCSGSFKAIVPIPGGSALLFSQRIDCLQVSHWIMSSSCEQPKVGIIVSPIDTRLRVIRGRSGLLILITKKFLVDFFNLITEVNIVFCQCMKMCWPIYRVYMLSMRLIAHTLAGRRQVESIGRCRLFFQKLHRAIQPCADGLIPTQNHIKFQSV